MGSVNLQKIAETAGVTPMSVSRALSGKPGVSDDTRKRIQKIADEMGYQPDPIMRAFRSYRSNNKKKAGANLAFFTLLPPQQAWKRNPAFRLFYDASLKSAKRFGYQLSPFWIGDPDLNPKRISQILYHRGVVGIILGGISGVNTSIEMDWSPFSVINLGNGLWQPEFNNISDAHFQNVRTCWQKAVEFGYKRIGIILGKLSDERDDHQWLAGYCVEQNISPLPDVKNIPIYIHTNKIDREKESIKKWVKDNRLDVVIGLDTVSKAIKKFGYKPPKDIGLISLMTTENESGVIQNFTQIGEVAVELLDMMIQRREKGIPRFPQKIFLKGQWQDGNTIKRQ